MAATLLASGMALGVGSAGSASAAEMPGMSPSAAPPPAVASVIEPAQDVGPMASCKSQPEDTWKAPDGSGSHAAVIYWHDYNNFPGGGDQDNFKINDTNLDGKSSSLWVKNNWTGKSYYKHVYNGDWYCMGVGNIPDGATASWKACGWDNGKILECKTGRVEE